MFKGQEWIGFLYGLSATVIFASFYILGRLLFGQYDVDPTVFTFMRFAVAGLFFVIVILCTGRQHALQTVLRYRFWPMMGLALSGIVGEGLLLMVALKYTTASRSSLFANTSPIITVLLACIFMRESIGKGKWFGMILGFAGIATALASRSTGDLFMTGTSWVGDALAVGSAVCWAAFTILGQRLVAEFGGFVTTTAAIILGSFILFAFSLFFPWPWQHFGDWRFWAYVIYAGIIVSGLANVLWIISLRYLDASRLGSMGYISCILAMSGSIACLKEKLDIWFIISVLLVFIGVHQMLRRNSSVKHITRGLNND